MATCRSCKEPIKWGMGPGGKWLALQPEPSREGTFAYLPDTDRVMELPRRWKTLNDIPDDLVRTIPSHMREWWAKLIEAPRYEIHSRECQQEVASSVGYAAEKVIG